MPCACGGDPESDSLLPYVDLPGVSCLNEEVDGSAAHALKARPPVSGGSAPCSVRSPSSDALLVFKIPFTCAVRVSALAVAGLGGGSPLRVRLFVNSPSLDAGDVAEAAAAAELAPPADATGGVWHGLRPGRFGAVHHLTVALLGAHGGAGLDIVFLGLRGVGAGGRAAVVHAAYEARAQPADHPAVADDGARRGGVAL